MTRGKCLFALSIVTALVGLVGVGWRHASPVYAWWHVRALARADDADRETRVRAVAALGEGAIGPLLAVLATADAAAARNLEVGLRAAVCSWTVDDPRSLKTMEMLVTAYDGLSNEGRRAVLHFAAAFAGRADDAALPAGLARLCGELVERAARDAELRPATLELAGALVEHGPPGQWHALGRSLAIDGLTDERAATRVAAIQIVLREPLRKDAELLARLLPFLQDADALVRRVTLVAIGTNTEIVREEHLLPLLHDSDPEVQRLCAVVLRGRGLTEAHLKMARLVSHADPAIRLDVIPMLREATDLDADVWLRLLTHDPAPAVRAAAARYAGRDPSDDLRRRLTEMARTDPSPTVREIARFYVDRSAVRPAGN